MIAGSLAAGAVAALVLTLVVFPGATESVITGSRCSASASAGRMLAVLSARRTSQPQPWACGPRRRDDHHRPGPRRPVAPATHTLTSLTLGVAAAPLALVVWMFVRMRRDLPGAGRWLVTPVLVVLAVACVGATVQNVTAGRVADAYPAPGQTYAVGDHGSTSTAAAGAPTVVLFNGLGEFSASWARIVDRVAATTRVCAYDRAGQGWSDDVDASPGRRRGRRGPPRACWPPPARRARSSWSGHSIGGPYAMTYADQYPDEVAGMVLLDSTSPRPVRPTSPSYPSSTP